ncbi:hypothetical protein [Filimonas lacunae]|nr:hypothetical protein [Filimonas lacunae]
MQPLSNPRPAIPKIACKILLNTPDSLYIIQPLFQSGKTIKGYDTLNFVNINKRIVPLQNFQLLRMGYFGTWGSQRYIVTADRILKEANGGFYTNQEPPVWTYHKLSDNQYKKLLDTLTKSLVLMLPANKKFDWNSVYDPGVLDFVIQSNSQTLIGQGLKFAPIHHKIYSYLKYLAQEDATHIIPPKKH